MKTPVIYYGGKTSMLTNILPLIPDHEVYTEVFFGGGSVFWAKNKAFNETINDKLDIVINFYQQLKCNYIKLKEQIDATCYSETHHKKSLFIIKNKEMFDGCSLAWAFWFSCNFSYGNKIGGGLKFSNDESLLPPQVLNNRKRDFTERLVSRIEHAHIENRDAIEVLKTRNVKKAFHYIDPPYFNADQGHYQGFKINDMQLLLEQCEKIKGKFILSNYNSKLLEAFIKKNDWWKREYTCKMRGMRKNDKNKIEVLVANFRPIEKLEFGF